MTCHACGEKPKDTAKDFTKAVIEIDNPEEVITLLRKVIIPASMGTEEQVPAAVGKYRNVILYYEANKHVYIYSSDGIPTLLEVEIPQEILDRIEALEDGLDNETEARAEADETLQEEIDALKNSPDVVDIVPTYAALQTYDTSSLGDNDIIRVLADETHDGESTYYRWNLNAHTWNYIGAVGPYYTKDQTDNLLNGKQDNLTSSDTVEIVNNVVNATNTGKAKVLTEDDYNWNSTAEAAVEPFNGVALWLLPAGIYCKRDFRVVVYDYKGHDINSQTTAIVGVNDPAYEGRNILRFNGVRDLNLLLVDKSSGTKSSDTPMYLGLTNNLESTSTTTALTARQGKELKDIIDALVIPTVTQTTGTSTTNVMSQNAVSELVGQAKLLTTDDFNWNTTTGDATEPFDSIALWLLPSGTYRAEFPSVTPVLFNSTTWALATDYQREFVATVVQKVFGSTPAGAILCVAYHRAGGGAERPQIFDVETSTTSPYWKFNQTSRNSASPNGDILIGNDIVDGVDGLNSTNHYKVLSAWQGYVLNNKIEDRIKVPGATAPTTSTIGKVGELYAYVENGTGHLAICTEATSNPTSYTWNEVSGPEIAQTIGTSNTAVMSQRAASQMVYNGDTKKVSIGANAAATANWGITIFGTTNKENAIAIGYDSDVTAKGAIALGVGSRASTQGVFDVGLSGASSTVQSDNGYNGSEYRLLSGLYDPQNAHDAATKGYVDPVTNSSAPTTSTPGNVGKIYIDTSTETAYMCVNSSGGTYTWKQITN